MNHKELDVWIKSMDLVAPIYKISNAFPDSEKFGLSSQMRRAAISIPSNIAEGAGIKGDKELVHFIHPSLRVAFQIRNTIFNCCQIELY